jgi:hypothetical protein
MIIILIDTDYHYQLISCDYQYDKGTNILFELFEF